MRLAVRVQPRASRDAIVGWQGGELKVALTAPPVEGQANAALQRFLAKALGLRKAQVSLALGQAGRHKLLDLEMDEAAFRRALAQHL